MSDFFYIIVLLVSLFVITQGVNIKGKINDKPFILNIDPISIEFGGTK